MLSRALRSGWGVLLPGTIVATLACIDLPLALWKGMIVSGLLLTAVMIWHKELRHFVLLPSCVALISGMLLLMMNLK